MTSTEFEPLDFQITDKNVSLREGTAISNIDGRLWGEVGEETGRYFGDEAMVRARIGVEARYLIALSKVKVVRKLNQKERFALLNLHTKVTPKVYGELRQIEAEVRHDVISMTQIMKRLLRGTKSLDDVIDHGWVHWGLTSEDVDNLSKSVLISQYLKNIYLPMGAKTLEEIAKLAQKGMDVVIPGKTHLQTAIPTTFGKETAIFGIRLAENFERIKNLKLRGKLTGAVGTLAAHKLTFPDVDWRGFSRDFVKSLKLEPNLFTTQVEPKNRLIELFGLMQNINSTLIDFSQDMRIYIGFNWLTQETKKEESGSSAMPQKVNPIDFENSQGNALFSNWILEGLIRQMPVSWLQRDLVDKTIFRNLGLPFGHSLLALLSANKGLSRVTPNAESINKELDNDWGMLSEAYQIKLRAYGLGNSYETLKELFRGRKIIKEDLDKWIDGLNIKTPIKKELKALNHGSYIGYATESGRQMMKIISRTARKIRS